MDDPAVLAAALAESGFDGEKILALVHTREVKDELLANATRSVERGAFGSPTFFVGDENLLPQGPAARRRGADPRAPLASALSRAAAPGSSPRARTTACRRRRSGRTPRRAARRRDRWAGSRGTRRYARPAIGLRPRSPRR